MGSNDLPEQVRALIARHIDSVLDLDILLAIRASEGKRPAAELARELRLNEAASLAALEKFAAAGFVARDEAGFEYQPAGPHAPAVSALAETYASRRVSVIRFIYDRPSKGVSAFADAFRFRRDG